MNSENSKTPEPHVLILQLTDKSNLGRSQKSVALSNLSIYFILKNIKSSYNNIKFKISAPIWNDKFEDESYSISEIQDYFEYISKNHGKNIDSSSVWIYINRTERRITFKIKTRYYLKLLTSETMKWEAMKIK